MHYLNLSRFRSSHASCIMLHAYAIPSYRYFELMSVPYPVALLRVIRFVGFFPMERRFGYHYSFICWKDFFPFLSLLIFLIFILPRRVIGPSIPHRLDVAFSFLRIYLLCRLLLHYLPKDFLFSFSY